MLSLNFFFFNDTATTEIYTLSLHDALPISTFPDLLPKIAEEYERSERTYEQAEKSVLQVSHSEVSRTVMERSEEHTSELQSRLHLVCRLLLEKKKSNRKIQDSINDHHDINK